jgi:hypothetical protein
MREEAEKIGMTAKLLSQKQALKKLNKNAESKQRFVRTTYASVGSL